MSTGPEMMEHGRYKTPAAMRTALEERLNRIARETGRDIQRLRRQVAFDRLLARFSSDRQNGAFVLKGGYAIELRLHKARTTKDIDLCINGMREIGADNRSELLKEIRRAATIACGDFFEYLIGEPILDLENAPYGGCRFPVECRLAGRRFAHFNIDVATGDVWLDTHEDLTGNEWMDFAGIPAPKIAAISVEQQFAEKIHSYTLPRQTPNSRTKDLIDLVLFIEECNLDKKLLRDAVAKTFERRKTHEIPDMLDNPPESWRERYKKMAAECRISGDIDAAILKVRKYYGSLFETG